MCCSRSGIWIAFLLLVIARGAAAEHVIGLGADFDTEDGRAFSALGSLGVGEKSWLNASASYNVSRGGQSDLETVYLDAGFDHHFDPVGVRLGVGYWGDSELLDANDLRASLYWSGDKGSLSVDYERRAFDLTLSSPLLQQTRFIEFDADGLGLAARLQLSDRVSVFANGMHYEYSRNISLEPRVDVLRVFALSRLNAVNSLLDDRISAGIELELGDSVLDLRAARWRTAVFGDRVDSLGVGWLMPLAASSDIELRLSSDDTEVSGRATLFSVFLYFYGD